MKRVFQRLVLVFLGIIIPFLFLEVSLQALSYIARSSRNISYSKERLADNHLRILTLGESTTEGFGTHTWPDQLEEILSAKYKTLKFQVINRGITSTDSGTIATLLPEWIKQFKPHVVISMVGINDKINLLVFEDAGQINKGFSYYLKYFRSYRFIKGLIRTLLSNAHADDNLVAENPNSELIKRIEKWDRDGGSSQLSPLPSEQELSELFSKLWKIHEIGATRSVLKALYTFYPNEKYFLEAANWWMRPDGDVKVAFEIMQKAISFDSKNPIYYYTAGKILDTYDPGKALKFILEAINLDPSNAVFYHDLLLKLRASNLPLDQYKDLFEDLPEKAKEKSKAYLYLSEYYAAIEDVKNAENALKEARSSIPYSEEAFYKSAIFYSQNADYKSELMVIQEGIRKIPTSESLRLSLAESLLNNQRYIEAVDAMSEHPSALIPREYQSVNYSKKDRAASILLSRALVSANGVLTDNILNFMKANNLKSDSGLSYTKYYYKRIFDLTTNSGAVLIAMQYPRMPLEELEKILNYNENIVFVENVSNFETALQKNTFEELFTDNFGGSFGHLTDYGNSLIANNAAEAIDKVFNLDH